MLSSLVKYLFKGSASSVQDPDENNILINVDTLPIEARLRQVEVEGNDWILIDRTGINYIKLLETIANQIRKKFCK